MPWGKFKGQDIESIPSGYLRWLAENIKEDNPQKATVCLAADKEYQFREKNNCHID